MPCFTLFYIIVLGLSYVRENKKLNYDAIIAREKGSYVTQS